MLCNMQPYLLIGKFYNEYFYLPQINGHLPGYNVLEWLARIMLM